MQFRTIALCILVTSACRSSSNAPSGSPGSAAAPAHGSAAPALGSPAPAGSSAGAAAGSAAAPAAADPCGYATKEEVGAAIGKPIVATRQASRDQCAYFAEPEPSNGLYVRVTDSAPYDSMKQIMHDMTPVSGLGDDAMWGGAHLHVKAGSKMIAIGVMDVRWNHGDSKGAAVAVARAVLARLPH